MREERPHSSPACQFVIVEEREETTAFGATHWGKRRYSSCLYCGRAVYSGEVAIRLLLRCERGPRHRWRWCHIECRPKAKGRSWLRRLLRVTQEATGKEVETGGPKRKDV